MLQQQNETNTGGKDEQLLSIKQAETGAQKCNHKAKASIP